MSLWPKAVRLARQQGALLLFGDEASFPQWGTLSYTWSRKGQQPQVPTSGVRKGYKVFGLIDYFTGRFFYQGQDERLDTACGVPDPRVGADDPAPGVDPGRAHATTRVKRRKPSSPSTPTA